MNRRVTLLPLCAAIASVSITGTPAAAAPELSHTTVLSDLNEPWDMAFLPDETMFFTEKCHGLSVRMPDGTVNNLLGMEETEGYASSADDLFCLGQAGMMGVAIDPDFDDNRHIYVYSTSNMSDPHTNRVMRFTVNEDFTEVSDRTDIVEDIPYKMAESDHPFGGAGAHNGGRIRFGPDGYLWVTTGDNHRGEGPQSGSCSPARCCGSTPTATPPRATTRPRASTSASTATASATCRASPSARATTRSSSPSTGRGIPTRSPSSSPAATAAGTRARTWPGREDCPDDYCGYSPNQMEGMDPAERAAFMPMTDTETYPDALPPAWTNNGLSQGTSSAAFLEGEQWGDWEGRMVVGIMGIGFGGTPVGQRIDVINLADDGMSAEAEEMPLPMEPGRFRSVVLGPDGALYTAVDEGMIYQITPN
jgi:aldose sugar dehydrogenase